MFILTHKEDCSIVLNGPTEEGPAFKVSDGKGGLQDMVRTSATVCTCGGVLARVLFEPQRALQWQSAGSP